MIASVERSQWQETEHDLQPTASKEPRPSVHAAAYWTVSSARQGPSHPPPRDRMRGLPQAGWHLSRVFCLFPWLASLKKQLCLPDCPHLCVLCTSQPDGTCGHLSVPVNRYGGFLFHTPKHGSGEIVTTLEKQPEHRSHTNVLLC